MIAGALYNSNGKVAVRYKEPIPKFVKVHGREYVFTVRYSVALCWVEEEDVEAMLAQPTPKPCCGGGARSYFSLANQASLNCWNNGGR